MAKIRTRAQREKNSQLKFSSNQYKWQLGKRFVIYNLQFNLKIQFKISSLVS